MSQADLRTMIDHASGWAQKQFARHGEIIGIWHAVRSSGEPIVIPQPNMSKALGFALVRAAFELHDVIRYIWTSEAWTLPSDATAAECEEAARNGIANNPALASRRVEVVSFSGEDHEAGQIAAHRLIIRPPGGRPRLGPLEFLPITGFGVGRAINLLPRRGPSH